MKKIYMLIAPLISLGFLASCGGGSTPSGDVKFSVQETSVTVTNKTAVIHLDWEPTGDVIEFSNFTFTLSKDPITTYVTPGEASSRPLEITITFSSDLVKNDEGKLNFHYNDKTLKKEGNAEVKEIGVKIPPITEKRTLHFYGTNCVLKDGEGQVISTDIIVDKGTSVTYFIDGDDGYLKPKDNQIDFVYTDDSLTPFTDEHSYNPETGEVSVKLNENVTIYAASDPITPITYDEIQIPSAGGYPSSTLHAVNGIIRIKITNATTISPDTNFHAASCNLSDEPSEITTSTPKVFSMVKMSYDETTEESLTYDVFNADDFMQQRLQYWSINFESKPTENNIYIIIVLNNNYVSSATGRTIKQNYTGEVSCSLYNEFYVPSYGAGILIDYDSITEQPTL